MATIPSISFIPSGYKAGKLYSVLPTNGNADLTVVRNSTANRINKDGLIESMAVNVPLLDHSNGLCPSLLLQPQSTNLITYPLSFDNAYWTKSGATVVSGQSAPSVDNPTSAFKLVEGSQNEDHLIKSSTGITVSIGSVTHSYLIKSSGVRYVALFDASVAEGVFFDLDLGVVGSDFIGSTDSSSIKLLGNEFYRISITVTVTSTASSPRLYLSNNGSTVTYQGDGTSGVYIFGAQLEQQSFATSLMLPNAEGQTATRFKDEVSKSGLSSEINSVEGTLFVEMAALGDDGTNRVITLNDGTSANRVQMYFNTSNQIVGGISAGGSGQANITHTVDIKSFLKVAFKYGTNDFALWINGIKVGEDLIGNAPTGLNALSFDNTGGTLPFYGKVKNIQVYKTALTDAELIDLTTI